MLISSIHGRDRRKLRQIGKRDLLAAIKYGTREAAQRCRLTGEQRWKYTFANIVYITDYTSTYEITSYVQPIDIQLVPLDEGAKEDHIKLKKRLTKNPELCSSHTVLVVDMSGSMRTSDVDNFRNRADAVYGTLALDFIGAQLDGGLLKGTDVVSVIEMRDEAAIVFEREPITNYFFNKILEQRTLSKPYSHGNYINAFEAAEELFERDADNDTCALLLIFLSDGKPSDQIPWFNRGSTVQDIIGDKIESMAHEYGRRFILGTVGFAKDQDFTVLNQMAKDATRHGSTGIFLKSESCAAALSRSISKLTSSLSLTRTSLSSLGHAGGATKKLRKIGKEEFNHNPRYLSEHGWNVYEENVFKAYWSPENKDWIYYDLKKPILGFAVRKKSFGEGAERIVFQLVELGKNGVTGTPLVAKDSRFVQESELEKMEFHQTFCETQMKARELAIKFNKELALRGNSKFFPQIKFLDCFVYIFYNENDVECGLLVEKMLDHSNYKKWNGNDGSVDGVAKQSQNVNLEELFENLQISSPSKSKSKGPRALGSIERTCQRVTFDMSINSSLGSEEKKDSDFPQAFSHWTYYHTKRDLLVCDLQGVLDKSSTPSVFEFTDPAIHCSRSSSKKGYTRKFGRTDRGTYGIHDFFKTHECNAVCRLLGLPSDK
ncbi:UNVERIFIED_CONTAM: hypothetical protein HDU68_000940 [Siphonaria sp. JEL0065]|nr:hypothetical protein HDU68_000940 [Siphonaria sp. JEL0065]